VISFHSIFFLFFGLTRSSVWITVKISGIALLLSDRRQNADLAISDLEDGFIGIAIIVSDVDAMQSFDGDLVHFVGNRVIPIPSQAVNASPDHEMRSSFSSRPK